jgi:hypothetical protein
MRQVSIELPVPGGCSGRTQCGSVAFASVASRKPTPSMAAAIARMMLFTIEKRRGQTALRQRRHGNARPRFGLGVIWSHISETLFLGLSCGCSMLQDMAGRGRLIRKIAPATAAGLSESGFQNRRRKSEPSFRVQKPFALAVRRPRGGRHPVIPARNSPTKASASRPRGVGCRWLICLSKSSQSC